MAGKGVAVAIFLAVVFSTATLSRSATHAPVAAPPSTSPARSPVAAPPNGIVPQLPSPAPGSGGGGGSSSSDGPTIPSTLSPPNPDAVGSPTSSPAKSSSVTETFPRPTYITWGILCVVVFLLPEWLV